MGSFRCFPQIPLNSFSSPILTDEKWTVTVFHYHADFSSRYSTEYTTLNYFYPKENPNEKANSRGRSIAWSSIHALGEPLFFFQKKRPSGSKENPARDSKKACDGGSNPPDPKRPFSFFCEKKEKALGFKRKKRKSRKVQFFCELFGSERSERSRKVRGDSIVWSSTYAWGAYNPSPNLGPPTPNLRVVQ